MPAATSRIAESPKSAAETSIPNRPPNSTIPWATCCGALALAAPASSAATTVPQHMTRNRNAA